MDHQLISEDFGRMRSPLLKRRMDYGRILLVFGKHISSSSWINSQTTFSSPFVITFGPVTDSGHWNLNGSCTVITKPYPEKSSIYNSLPPTPADLNKL